MTGVAGSPRRSPEDFGWTKRSRVPGWSPLKDDGARVTFGNIVAARYLLVTTDDADIRDESKLLVDALWEKFERQERGPIRNTYFGETTLGGVAIVGDRADSALHTVLNSSVATLVKLEATCNVLADQIRTTLARTGQESLIGRLVDAVFSAMARVVSAADLPQDAPDDVRAATIAAAEGEVELAATRAREAIQRQARFIYFQGALAGTVVAIVVSVLLGMLGARYWGGHINVSALVAATLFGALGAVVSVFQRISTGQLVLDFNASRGQLRSLGALRPFVGSVFGTVTQFALASGLVGTGNVPTTTSFGVFALIGFTAGFSERFATDMVERAGQVLAGTAPEPKSPTPPGA